MSDNVKHRVCWPLYGFTFQSRGHELTVLETQDQFVLPPLDRAAPVRMRKWIPPAEREPPPAYSQQELDEVDESSESDVSESDDDGDDNGENDNGENDNGGNVNHGNDNHGNVNHGNVNHGNVNDTVVAEQTRQVHQLRQKRDEQEDLIERQKDLIRRVEEKKSKYDLQLAWRMCAQLHESGPPIRPILQRSELWEYELEDDELRYHREVRQKWPMSPLEHELEDLKLVTEYNRKLLVRLQHSIEKAEHKWQDSLYLWERYRRREERDREDREREWDRLQLRVEVVKQAHKDMVKDELTRGTETRGVKRKADEQAAGGSRPREGGHVDNPLYV
ncbi:hypothetical protein Z517_09401 [Fonsecaea pedrosoi CBS 271.37]|uniref:Uncharacterized protein n=1 Tax=Fonsecaea pedrosoi CBS 271.37 TaxID=1442368 RepID=A0A0D2ERT7_9EURO|nr:uncharacterized protein Z517_09401 [Fonsecaea pedrosoi CBS 271.37]KIW76957.1 hypothetical protein Z517_09401 [Fonsecaea pedrosoi CBS 271.37]